jgi:hypothetical protein
MPSSLIDSVVTTANLLVTPNTLITSSASMRARTFSHQASTVPSIVIQPLLTSTSIL